jgi:osmotically-inducible protein OsmY
MTQVRLSTIALATLLLAGAGCARDEARETTAGQAAPSDASITMAIQSRYFGDDAVKAHAIDVDTDHGVVTLSGTVESDAARSRAATIAQGVDGVSRVQNDLRVADAQARGEDQTRPGATAPRPDARTAAGDPARRDRGAAADQPGPANAGWITTKIQAQYFADADVKGRNIDVTTDRDGQVTLAGEVGSDAERREAVRIARATEGVRDVVDQLKLAAAGAARPEGGAKAPADARPDSTPLEDSWITMKIESKYFLDGEVKGRRIDVTTEQGIVTLDGQVQSAAEKRQAVLLARSTDGVKDVRDRLRVAAPAADESPRQTGRSTTEAVNDEWIETKIQSKYFLADDLKTDEIEVDSSKGVVTLQGRVESEAEKRTAGEIARETDGVQQVVNRLEVTPSR